MARQSRTVSHRKVVNDQYPIFTSKENTSGAILNCRHWRGTENWMPNYRLEFKLKDL